MPYHRNPVRVRRKPRMSPAMSNRFTWKQLSRETVKKLYTAYHVVVAYRRKWMTFERKILRGCGKLALSCNIGESERGRNVDFFFLCVLCDGAGKRNRLKMENTRTGRTYMACVNETNMANRILQTTGGTALRTGRATMDLKGPKSSRKARTCGCKRRGVRWNSFGGELAMGLKQSMAFGTVLNGRVFSDNNLHETLVSVLATGRALSSPNVVRGGGGGDCTEFSF